MADDDFLRLEAGTLDVASFDLAGGGRGASLGGPDDCYRYDLWRRWSTGPTMGWLMLNPSTADALLDDHTIGRCRFYASREGFGTLRVRNLYALRTPSPDVLFATPEPERTGPDSDEWISRLRVEADLIVVAWGGDRRAWPRIEYVERELLRGWDVYCLAITKEGQPGHPARLPNDAPLARYGY